MYYIYNSILRDSLSSDLRGRASGLKWKSLGDTKPADGEELVHAALATALASLRAGDRVELHSLQAKPEYNGKCGTLVAFKAESGRWEVDFDGGGSLHVKATNLTKEVVGGGAADPAVVTLLPHEWAEFGISDLRLDHYVCIKIGTGSSARKCYLKPAGRDLTVNMYSTTIQVIVSGICKLSGIARMPAGSLEMVVFRGLAGVRLPEALVEKDEQGFAGVVDASFMSATTDEDLARKYSTAHPGRAATVFKLLLGKKSLGADMSWVSQFAGEREVLFAPRTHLQVVGEPVVGSGGVCVITVRPTTYQNVATVEEVLPLRKACVVWLSCLLALPPPSDVSLRRDATSPGDGVAQRRHAALVLEPRRGSAKRGDARRQAGPRTRAAPGCISGLACGQILPAGGRVVQ